NYIISTRRPKRGPRVLNSFDRRKIDEQAREEAGRAGRATATAAMAPEAGWPARPAVARQAGQSARAQADHVADAARTGPLGSDSSTTNGAPSRWWGAVAFPGSQPMIGSRGSGCSLRPEAA